MSGIYAARRDAVEAHLASIGVSGDAAIAILQETALHRHQLRCSAAIDAAYSHVIAHRGGDAECVCEVEPLMILLADMLGVGGRDGVVGASTLRHPGLHVCGKGRKQATDGAAWDAAIKEAALAALDALGTLDRFGHLVDGCSHSPIVHQHCPNIACAVCGVEPQTGDSVWWSSGHIVCHVWCRFVRGDWAWAVYRNDPSECPTLALECRGLSATGEDITVQSCGVDCLDPAWIQTIAREGLRRSVGLPGWHSHPVAFRGSAADWADFLNAMRKS